MLLILEMYKHIANDSNKNNINTYLTRNLIVYSIIY